MTPEEARAQGSGVPPEILGAVVRQLEPEDATIALGGFISAAVEHFKTNIFLDEGVVSDHVPQRGLTITDYDVRGRTFRVTVELLPEGL